MNDSVDIAVKGIFEVHSSSPASASNPLKIHGETASADFRKEVESLSGEKVLECYQCGECTAGCPAAFAMDIAPNRIISQGYGETKPVVPNDTDENRQLNRRVEFKILKN